ncbi:MAG: carboxypeptidase regulatory-like domain-containing protein [Bacteroidales bacterium]|nr:carboxypeptidase regulatory-like domain-containing protein [Bacteroidales bacterium]
MRTFTFSLALLLSTAISVHCQEKAPVKSNELNPSSQTLVEGDSSRQLLLQKNTNSCANQNTDRFGHFEYIYCGGAEPVYTIYFWGIALDSLELGYGDEAAIFDGNKQVGTKYFDSSPQPGSFDWDMIACSQLQNEPGYTPGNPFTLKCWADDEQIESENYVLTFHDPYGDAWTEPVFPEGDGVYSIITVEWTSLVTVNGIIYAADNEEPLSNVDVTITGTSFSAITDEDGYYEIDSIPAGVYDMVASAQGFQTETQSDVELEEGQQVTVDFFLEASEVAPFLIDAQPGPGYIVLTWEGINSNSERTGHFDFYQCDTGPSWTQFIQQAQINNEDMVAGDEVAVYDGDLLVGAFTLSQVCSPENVFENDFPACSDVGNGDGYTVGNPVSYVAWDESTGIEISDCTFEFLDPYGDAWTEPTFPPGESPYSIMTFQFYSDYEPSYNIYRDDELIGEGFAGNHYTDFDANQGTEYCYCVTQIMPDGDESDPSNIRCASPTGVFNAPLLRKAEPGVESVELSWEPIGSAFYGDYFQFQGVGGPVWTNYISMATVNNQDMLPEDEIAIFDGDVICAAYILERICTPDNMYENDLHAFMMGPGGDTLYHPGNPVIYKAWDKSEGTEIEDFEVNYLDPNGDAWTEPFFPEGDGEYSIIELNFSFDPWSFNVYEQSGNLLEENVIGHSYTVEDVTPGSDECYYITQILENGEESDPSNMLCEVALPKQHYELAEGYQFISSRYIPDDPDMLDVLEDILDEHLDFVRNSNGNMVQKVGPEWINGIGDWITEEGYLVKMNLPNDLSIEGQVMNPFKTITLDPGYEFISYLPDSAVNALTAFENILDEQLDFIRNSNGEMLQKIGDDWINNIGDAAPGEGYLVRMEQAHQLVYSGNGICPDVFTFPEQGVTYEAEVINGQCWIAENANSGEFLSSGEPMTDNDTIEKYCLKGLPYNCDKYGGLYTWDEAMQYNADTINYGICPEGWYVATDHEWKVLEGSVDSQYGVGDPQWENIGSRGYDAGFMLKEEVGWYSNGNGKNLYDFAMRPASWTLSPDWVGMSTWFWNANETNDQEAWYRYATYDEPGVSRNPDGDKTIGLSVRCVHRDVPANNTLHQSKQKPEESFLQGGNPADAVFMIYLQPAVGIHKGDRIAAFDGDKMVGLATIQSNDWRENQLPVFSTLAKGAGYKPGNSIQLKRVTEEGLDEMEFDLVAYYDAYTSRTFPEGDGLYGIAKVSTGLENNEAYISIYPNPANNKVNIKASSDIRSIEIYQQDGKLLRVINNIAQTAFIIDLSRFDPGTYILEIRTNNKFNREKLVVR